MSKTHSDQLVFRDWLIRQLVMTRWPMKPPTPELADELGVTVSVMREAFELRAQATAKRGKTRPRQGAARTDHALLRIYLPKVVYRDWAAYRKVLTLSNGAMLRSLVHHFLLDPKRPTTTDPSWHYRGGVYRITPEDGSPPKLNICTRITRGAEAALDHHALGWDVSPSAVLRGLVIDLLEGRTTRLKIIGYRELWGDPARYLTPEKFR